MNVQVDGSGDLVNPAGQDIGDYTTDFGGAWLSINGEEGIWTVPAFAYYFPSRQNPSYRISATCILSGPDGCKRWRLKKENKINGQWVEDSGPGPNELVKS